MCKVNANGNANDNMLQKHGLCAETNTSQAKAKVRNLLQTQVLSTDHLLGNTCNTVKSVYNYCIIKQMLCDLHETTLKG